MPQILLKLYDRNDNEIFIWMPYGNEKKRRKVIPVKQSRIQRFFEDVKRLWGNE